MELVELTTHFFANVFFLWNSPFQEISASWRCLEYSLSQARQLCRAGLSVAILRQASGDFNGNVVKCCCWKGSDGCRLCVHTSKSDNRYLLEGRDRDTNSANVHRSGGHQALSVLSHVCKSRVVRLLQIDLTVRFSLGQRKLWWQVFVFCNLFYFRAFKQPISLLCTQYQTDHQSPICRL